MDAKARGLRKLPTALTKKGVLLSMRDLKVENGRLYLKNSMYVPDTRHRSCIFCCSTTILLFKAIRGTRPKNEQTRFANRNRQPHPEYKVGDEGIINNKAFELEIPQQMKDAGLTPIFHPWKMHLAPDNPFPGQILPPHPPVWISAEDDERDHAAHDSWAMRSGRYWK
ncbi:hypothetical protein MMC22_003465 [Lobaria immixta]|nr:hypothetical protein [Lobaria immixta]